MIMRRPTIIVLAVVAALLMPGVVVRAATNDTISELSLSGSPFATDFAPLPQAVNVRVRLARPARVWVAVFNEAGQRVRFLARRVRLVAGDHVWSWDGRKDSGAEADDGIYRIQVRTRNGLGVALESRHVRKGLPAIYPANPAALVIVIDPGHGGRFVGAAYAGVGEDVFNLDIALKLKALLARAGVTVILTRASDVAVDEPASDVNADGLVNGFDDLAARNDIANLARADINLHIHNNGATCHCYRGTEVFTSMSRSWTPAGLELAGMLQREQLFVLDQYRDNGYFPIDRGVKSGSYYYMAPYSVVCPTAQGKSDCSPPYLPRPVLMPSVLTESLFVNGGPGMEFDLLMRPDVRTSLAASFYIALAEYLNTRAYGLAYELVQGPPPTVAAGSPVSYRLRLTNRGNLASAGWQVQFRSVPAVPLYDGSDAAGELLGSATVPDGLAPGASIEIEVAALAPAAAGDWLIKADVRLPDDTSFALAGIAALQVPLTTTPVVP